MQGRVFVIVYSLIALCCAMLIGFVLARTVRRSTNALVAICCIPILLAFIGVYSANGFAYAITFAFACVTAVCLLVTGACIASLANRQAFTRAHVPFAPLLLPLGFVQLIAGFSGVGTPAGVIATLVIGVLAVDMMRDDNSELAARGTMRVHWLVAGLLALCLGALLFWSSRQFAVLAQASEHRIAAEAMIACLLAPVCIMPSLQFGTEYTFVGNLERAVKLIAGIVCVVIGFIVPAAIIYQYVMTRSVDEGAYLPGLPAMTWRLDAPLMVATGFGLLGLRHGLLSPDRWLGVLLILLYAAYLLASVVTRIY